MKNNCFLIHPALYMAHYNTFNILCNTKPHDNHDTINIQHICQQILHNTLPENITRDTCMKIICKTCHNTFGAHYNMFCRIGAISGGHHHPSMLFVPYYYTHNNALYFVIKNENIIESLLFKQIE